MDIHIARIYDLFYHMQNSSDYNNTEYQRTQLDTL